MHHRTYDGRVFRTLNVLDEFIRASLTIRVRHKFSSRDVIDILTDLFILRGIPAWIRSDDGPEFATKAVRQWIVAVGAQIPFIESFNARLRDDLLNGEIPYTLRKARILIVAWRRRYNTVRPHVSSLQHAVPILCSLLTDPCALPMSRKTATRSPHLPSLSITDFRGIDDITIPPIGPRCVGGEDKTAS